MKFLFLQPFVPSGPNFEKSKQLFVALGFRVNWEAPGMAGLQKDECRFILQHYDNREFAENFMLTVNIEDAAAFYRDVLDKGLPETFGIRINPPLSQPYGIEVNLIDIAGVCWHFIQS